MRPTLEGDLNSTQKCLSYGNVPTTSSAWSDCMVCQVPRGNPGETAWEQVGAGAGKWLELLVEEWRLS